MKKIPLQIRLSEWEYKKLKELSKKKEIPMNIIVRLALNMYFREESLKEVDGK